MPIPHDDPIDSTLSIYREGFLYSLKRFQRFQSDLFTLRVGGMPTTFIHGPEAASLFYDESKFQRRRAIPRRVKTTLFGQRAVHTLDDEAHRHRKAAFLSLMNDANLARLVELMKEEWGLAIARWSTQPQIEFFNAVSHLLTRSICRWAGVPFTDAEVPALAANFIAMVDAFGGAGVRLWRGKLARHRAQTWITPLIEKNRHGPLPHDPREALTVMAALTDTDDKTPIDAKLAGIELLNILRPTVAISWYLTFTLLALHDYPHLVPRLADPDFAERFMQEVRRFYPFAPFIGAKVRTEFTWQGHTFAKGSLTLLDIYGLHHDPKVWPQPNLFNPDRFLTHPITPFNLLAQGGGNPHTGHRCPGEWLTMQAILTALPFLTRRMTYTVMDGQDLRYSLRRMPTAPRSGVVLQNLRAATL